MDLGLSATDRIVKSESNERRTNTLLVLVFPWDLLTIRES